MIIFRAEPLIAIVQTVQRVLTEAELVSFAVPNPDLGKGLYAGERLEPDLIHRPWRVWFDLAEKLECRFLTPEVLDEHFVMIHLQKLKEIKPEQSFDHKEKYGQASAFARIKKLEESSVLLDYLEAFGRIQLRPGARVLSLGVNQAEEFYLFDFLGLKRLECVGIDHSSSALAEARKMFPTPNYQFINADINNLAALNLGRFDLVMALGTLQSPGIDDRAILRLLVQDMLLKTGSLFLSFPNSKYKDTELLYGARSKNYSQAELSLLLKDMAFYRKYLQQHAFWVFMTGKYYFLLTACPV